jgi:hypothetical protein
LEGKNMKTLKIVIVFAFAYALNGCVSQIAPLKDSSEQQIGRPFEELKVIITRSESYPSRIGWEEKTYQLESGNWVYIEPVRPDCFIHWEINKQGIIVSYKTEGNRCW